MIRNKRVGTAPAIPAVALLALVLLAAPAASAQVGKTTRLESARGAYPQGPLQETMQNLESELVVRYGPGIQPRLERGMNQVARFWLPEDGDAAAFADFIREAFAADPDGLDRTFGHLERTMEQVDGHMLEISRELRQQVDLDLGPILPVDEILASYDPSAHITDDFFENRLAFLVLLNFPLTTLEQRLSEGGQWSRRQWAETRLAQRFNRRVPAAVNLDISEAGAEAEKYIAQYNIWMHHLLTESGERLFPPKLRLLSHWNLRDEIKADYNDPRALEKQRMIQKVMERIVTQTIPAVVVDNPTVDWKPYSNSVSAAAVSDSDRKTPVGQQASADPEPNTRYGMLLGNFEAQRKLDPFSPTAPTAISRSFDEGREIPEERVRAMFIRVLTSPLVPRVAALIAKRLGRPLEPFDIWYNGFRARGKYTEAELDAIVAKKYPTAQAYQDDIPNLLQQLGFSKERAAYLAANIVVDPARGSGHAWGAARREDKAHLRTRVEKSGMNYKGYNIAVHEMGHNVEQTFSLNDIDHTLLQGVPNTAFTEALAFVFQGHDLELLGLSKPDATVRAMKTLDDFWGTYEIAGVALVEVAAWHWMYDHPDSSPAELRDAVVRISKDVWNQYYAPVFHQKDVALLGIYSHMIERNLYLPNYPLGHLIAFQIEQQMEKAGNIGGEFERMAKIGNIAPDLWMKEATGAPVGPDALLAATRTALETLDGKTAKK